MGKIVDIQNLDPNTLDFQDYSSEDNSLITNKSIDVIFDPASNYLEYFVLDLQNNILAKYEDGYPKFRLLDNNIILDPQENLESAGFEEGQYKTFYNFLNSKLSSSPSRRFYIEEISSDRTEVRLNTTQIENSDVVLLTNEFANEISSSLTYKDFYLNFGDNQLVIANNILLDNTNVNDPTVLIKLYEPLPQQFDLKAELWVVERIAESVAYQISLTEVFEFIETQNFLKGPNLNLDIKDQVNNSTDYKSLSNLYNTTSVIGSGSLTYQINSILADKGIELNIDYSDYENFVHFSSAQTRLENFYYKLALIEQYTYSGSLTATTGNNIYTSGSAVIWDSKINEIIKGFDGYEYYLYFNSGSKTWPKSNNQPPYNNLITTDVTATTWLTNQLVTASLFDNENKDNLYNAVPTYITEDDTNANYKLFIEMLGQHYDNIWVYIKDVTNKFNADNRLDYGISKDLIAQAIKDLGVKIYQNNYSEADLYQAMLGLSPSGSTFMIPYTTGSLPTPTGFEYINTYITASNTSSVYPLEDINKALYKRIYHNVPYLLKKKGTIEGLRALINIYGIPDTILRINEFGGTKATDSYDNFQEQFNYEFFTTSSGFIKTSWNKDSTLNTPKTVEFRFKTTGIPGGVNLNYSQSIAHAGNDFKILLEYTGSGLTSGSYSASIANEYYQFGNLKLVSSSISTSVWLPIFDEGWWSVMVTQTNNTNSIYVKNKIYDGYEGNLVGFQASGSFISTNTWTTVSSSFTLSTGSNQSINGKTYIPFSGSFQELRFYNLILSESKFNDYVMNPYSILGNSESGSQTSYNTLFFRAPLGTDLINSSSRTLTSIHPKITGSYISQSFSGSISNYYLSGSYSWIPQTETIYQNQVNVGIKNAVTEKIKIITSSLPSGNTLSQYRSIQQIPTTGSYSRDINYVEVAFSPQDEINDDIISQLGSFNIGNYIGDPRQISSSLNYYPDLNKLRNEYFSKYSKEYNLFDYIRLIKYIDNSLFKMIKDFTPARTSLASGIIIKPTLLERTKYPTPQYTTDTTIAFVCSATTKQINISST